MTSIFDLKTSVEELDSLNEGLSRAEFEQHPADRDISGSNFSNGTIRFKFQTSGQKWWVPSRSYIRGRFRLTKGDGTTQLVTADQIAPNMGFMSSLFQSGDMRINDKIISRLPDHMGYVDALETRLAKSKSWFDSVGDSTNWWEKDQRIRAAEVSSDGTLVKYQIPADTRTPTTRVGMGFDAPGANANKWTYAVNGNLTYNRGTDAAGLTAAGASAAFQIGDFFKFVGVLNTPEVEMKVLANDGAGNLVVEPLLNIAVDSGLADFARVRVTPAVAPASRQIEYFETTWTPPLSLFKVGHALPSGKYELALNPQTSTSIQKRAIESALGVASKTPTIGATAGDFKLEVVDMYLYVATVDGPRADNITYLIDLEQTRCQALKIDSASFGQKSFDVSPSTYALTVAYADLRAGEHTAISASKFRSYEAGNTPFQPQELKLERFFINFAGQNLPAPDANPEFVGGKDYTTQRYTETMINSGAYFDNGGAESIEDFHERGAYYYFRWPRDGTDRSTRVNVHQGFIASGADQVDFANLRVLLFDHSKQVARVRVQDGYVVDTQVEDG